MTAYVPATRLMRTYGRQPDKHAWFYEGDNHSGAGRLLVMAQKVRAPKRQRRGLRLAFVATEPWARLALGTDAL